MKFFRFDIYNISCFTFHHFSLENELSVELGQGIFQTTGAIFLFFFSIKKHSSRKGWVGGNGQVRHLLENASTFLNCLFFCAFPYWKNFKLYFSERLTSSALWKINGKNQSPYRIYCWDLWTISMILSYSQKLKNIPRVSLIFKFLLNFDWISITREILNYGQSPALRSSSLNSKHTSVKWVFLLLFPRSAEYLIERKISFSKCFFVLLFIEVSLVIYKIQ